MVGFLSLLIHGLSNFLFHLLKGHFHQLIHITINGCYKPTGGKLGNDVVDNGSFGILICFLLECLTILLNQGLILDISVVVFDASYVPANNVVAFQCKI